MLRQVCTNTRPARYVNYYSNSRPVDVKPWMRNGEVHAEEEEEEEEVVACYRNGQNTNRMEDVDASEPCWLVADR